MEDDCNDCGRCRRCIDLEDLRDQHRAERREWATVLDDVRDELDGATCAMLDVVEDFHAVRDLVALLLNGTATADDVTTLRQLIGKHN